MLVADVVDPASDRVRVAGQPGHNGEEICRLRIPTAEVMGDTQGVLPPKGRGGEGSPHQPPLLP